MAMPMRPASVLLLISALLAFSAPAALAAEAAGEAALGCGIFDESAESAAPGAEEKAPVPCVDLARRTYEYRAAEARDPFESLIKDIKEIGPEGKTPPELYDLNLIKLKAIISDGEKSYAMLLLPDSKHYTLEVNSKIGTKDGNIIDIKEDRIVVRELTIDFKGDKVVLIRELKLREEEEQQ